VRLPKNKQCGIILIDMSTIKRLMVIARPYYSDLIYGTIFMIVSTFLETAVLTAIITGLLTLITRGTLMPEINKNEPLPIPFLPENWSAQIYEFIERTPILKNPTGPDSIFHLFMILILIAVIVAFIKCVMQARGAYLNNRFSARLAKELRNQLFNKMVYMPPNFYEKESSGSLLSRITGDVGNLQSLIGPQLANILQSPVTVLLSLAIMVVIDWRITCAVLVLAPLIAITSSVVGRKIKKITAQMQHRLAELNSGIVEKLLNIKVIQSFVREDYEIKKVETLNYNYYRDTMKSTMFAEVLSPVVEYLSWIGMLLGAMIGGYFVLNGLLSTDKFFFFMLLAQRAGSQFKQLSRLNQLKQQVTATGDRIFEIMDTPSDIVDANNAAELSTIIGKIEFNDVEFSYPTSPNPVLKNISLNVTAGEVIALVGASGSGKSTLANLLPRFYNPDKGTIFIDDYDIAEIKLSSLRQNIGIVPQETLLFSGTIYDNIVYGNLDATDKDVERAATIANALEFIRRMPEGFETVIGEKGARLSGGQRQRIAIARAVLKNPKILVLDEATSALDTESEYLVQQALERLMESRTTFVIAHRLSTIKNADRIVVLNKGEIVEVGSHSELLSRNGIYANLYNMQFSTSEN